MSEILDRLRALFEGISEPVDVDAVMAAPAVVERRGRGWLVAAAAAAIALAVGAASLLLIRGGQTAPSDSSVPPTSPTTTAPTTTSLETTSTRASTTTTTEPTGPAVSGPVVIADVAENIGVAVDVPGSADFSLNPFLEGYWPLAAELHPLVFAGAWREGPDGEPRADLVESLPAPGDGTAILDGSGNLTLAYRINPSARWSDGVPVTAADFQQTLALLQDEAMPIRGDWRQWHAGVEGFEAVSETEFRVTLRPPLTRYRHLFPVVVPAHAVDPASFAADWNEVLWPSLGPLRLASFERLDGPLAGAMSFEPNPESPIEPAIAEGLRIDFYRRDERGESLAIQAFAAGRADLLAPGAFGFPANAIPEGAALASSPAQIWEALFLQPGPRRLEVNPDSQLDDPAVRRAVAQALLGPAADLPGRRITSLVEFYIPGTANPDGGWAADFGIPAPSDPVPLVYESTDGETTVRIGRAVEPRLEAGGFFEVTTRFDPDASAAFTRFREGAFETFAIRLVRTPGSVALFDLFQAFIGEGFPDAWPQDGSRGVFLAALDGFPGELDPARRRERLVEAEQALVEAMTIVPLVTREYESWAYHPDRLVGPADYPIAGTFLAGFPEWRRP